MPQEELGVQSARLVGIWPAEELCDDMTSRSQEIWFIYLVINTQMDRFTCIKEWS